MRILVCGDRNWDNQKVINKVLDTMLADLKPLEKLTIIEGENGVVNPDGTVKKGADRMAGYWADQHSRSGKVEKLPFPARWSEFGRAAGPIRNTEMLTVGQPDLVVAFHNDIKNSKGTKDMCERAQRAGVRTIVVDCLPPDPNQS